MAAWMTLVSPQFFPNQPGRVDFAVTFRLDGTVDVIAYWAAGLKDRVSPLNNVRQIKLLPVL